MEENVLLLEKWRQKICLDKYLSSKDKLTAFAVSMFVDENLAFVPNVREYSAISNLQQKTVARSLGHLRSRNYILQDYQDIYCLGGI